MPRGGARRGAGRPQIPLDTWERMRIGAMCENLQNAMADEAGLRVVDEALSDVTELRDELWPYTRSIPVEKRASWLRSSEAEEHFKLVQEARAEAQKHIARQPKVNGRYALREKVLDRVRAERSEALGVELTRSYVERCWKEYRSEILRSAANL